LEGGGGAVAPKTNKQSLSKTFVSVIIQQDAKIYNLFIFPNRFTCFGWSLQPSSYHCVYSSKGLNNARYCRYSVVSSR